MEEFRNALRFRVYGSRHKIHVTPNAERQIIINSEKTETPSIISEKHHSNSSFVSLYEGSAASEKRLEETGSTTQLRHCSRLE